MEYSQEVLYKAKNLRVRYSLVKMRDQCDSKIENSIGNKKYNTMYDWIELKKGFIKLLSDYNNDIKLNEEYILKLYGIKFNDNILAIKRLIKLIKIV